MITSQTYEADGQTKAIAYANGMTTTFTYSPTRRWVMSIVTKNASSAELVANTYTRNLASRITKINGNGTVNDWTYTYDDFSAPPLSGKPLAGVPVAVSPPPPMQAMPRNLKPSSMPIITTSYHVPVTRPGLRLRRVLRLMFTLIRLVLDRTRRFHPHS